MAESGEETERKITVTVKTPKEKQEIEVEGDATVKEVISEIFDCMFIQFLQDYFLNVTDVFRKCYYHLLYVIFSVRVCVYY